MKLIGNSNNKKHTAPKHAAEHGKHAAHGGEHAKHTEPAKIEQAQESSLAAAEMKPAEAQVQSAPQPKAEAAGHAGKAKKSGGMKKGARAALVTLAVVVVVALGVIIGYSMWETPPDIVGPSALLSTPTPNTSSTPNSGNDPSTSPDESPEPTEPIEVDEFDGALMTERDDGIYTFLLVGRDYASNSTDTIVVGKFDTNKHIIDMVNIPRDTLINISWGTTPKKINAVYPGYINSGGNGIEGLRSHVKNLLGFDVDFYAVVNINVVVDVIDAIGGVDFDVPINMDYDDSSQHFHVHLKKGYQHLSGYEALGVFRFRTGGYVGGVLTPGYPGGDVQRIQTQQALLMAIASQMLSLGNIPNLTNIIDLCVKNVETTLNASNMAFFARQFLKCSMDNINFHDMPIAAYNNINGVSYVSIAINDWLELVNERLNPYSQPVTKANVSILSANESGTWIDSTTGYIAGSWESFYCQTCSAKNGWKATYHTPGACPSDEPVTDDPFASESPSVDDPFASESPSVSETPSVPTTSPELPTITDDPFASVPPAVTDAPVVDTPPADTPVTDVPTE